MLVLGLGLGVRVGFGFGLGLGWRVAAHMKIIVCSSGRYREI